MPIPDEFNKFTLNLYEDTFVSAEKRRTLTSKFNVVCDIIDYEKASILWVGYMFVQPIGTTLYIDYFANSIDKFNKPYIAKRRITMYNSKYINKCDVVYEMYTNERFLSYFKVCLRYNEPEIAEI